MRVLIVEDYATLVQLLTRTVTSTLPGCLVDVAESANTALSYLSTHRYSAVVTDILITGGNGLELMDRIHAVSPHTPVILMTALPALVTPASRANAFGVLNKPFSPSEFITAVRQAVSSPRLAS